jgi:murein DD-endopeptidase MepM/ murein hydrolase activator NlpD
MRFPIELQKPYPRRGRGSFMYERTATHHHRGVDLVAPKGTPVVAVGDGVIEHAVQVPGTPGFRGYGKTIVLKLTRLDGLRALYAHLDTVLVKQGDRVVDGQQIGTVGATEVKNSGAHLHFEIATRAYPMPSEADRLNPAFFLGCTCQNVP